MGKRGGLVLLFAWLVSAAGVGQSLVWNDTLVLLALKNPVDPGISLVRYHFTQSFDYSFSISGMLFLNWQQGSGNNQACLLQRLNYRTKLYNNRTFSITTNFVHNLGFQYFFDSISRFQPDDNTLDTRFEIRVRKNFTFSFLSSLATRLFNAYDYAPGQAGILVRTLRSSFLTPLVCTFSAGFGFSFPRLGTLTMGLSAGKLTFIRDPEIYEAMGVNEFFGVAKGRAFLFEYGLSIHLAVDKDFLNRIHWNCDVQIFKNYKKPIDLVMKNLVGIRINKFLKTSIQTRVFYEEQTSRNVQVENLVSIGFYFAL
jgi:hypothetical protein